MFRRFGIALSVISAIVATSCSSDGVRVDALPCEIDSVSRAFVAPDGKVMECVVPASDLSPVFNGFFNASLSDGIAVFRWNNGKPEAVEGLSKLKSAGYFADGVIPVSRSGHHIELADTKGTVVAVLELPEGEITECDPCFVGDVLAVTTDKALRGFVDRHGEIVVNPVYASVGPVIDKRFVAMSSVEGAGGQSYAVVDTEGHTVYDFPADVVPVDMKLQSGRVVVRTASGFGVCDIESGGTVTSLPVDVRAVTETSDGLIVFRAASGMKGLLDLDGNQLLSPVYRQIRIGNKGRVAVFDGNVWSLMDKNGDRKIDLPGFNVVSPAGPYAMDSGFSFVGQTPAGYFLLDTDGEKLNQTPLSRISYGDFSVAAKVISGYPSAVTPVELPFEDEADF